MIHIEIKKERWDNLIQSLLELGCGRVDQQLQITGKNDEFEGGKNGQSDHLIPVQIDQQFRMKVTT